MKKIIVLLCLFLASPCFAEGITSGTCEECPPGADCTVSVKIGCNWGIAKAWCLAGKWDRGPVYAQTLLYCGGMDTSTPFEPDKEGWK